MRIRLSLALVFLSVLFFDGRSTHENQSGGNCHSLKVSYAAVKLNAERIEISLSVKGGEEPYYYLFLDKNNKPLNWEFDKNLIQVDITQAPAKMKVTDAAGCLKMIQFNESEIK